MSAMQRIVRVFPILPGQEAQARQFAHEMGTSKADEAGAFYKRFGIAHECWYAQETPHGLHVVAITDFDGRAAHDAAGEYAASTAPFDAWFKSKVLEISGIDASKEPLGPPTECVFDWPPQHS
jgi:hypothetical protein